MCFTIGSDPEFILLDDRNRVKSAIGILKNKKKASKYKNNYYYYDNVLAECTVIPASGKQSFINNLRESLRDLNYFVHPYKISLLPSARFPAGELIHPDSRIQGCSPEQCAYNMETVDSAPVKDIITKTNLRTAGGHLHFGFKNKDHTNILMTVRMLDLFVGIPSLLIDATPSHIRRKIYGRAGRYRQPDYGLEYRSLGNFWLASPEISSLIYDLCEYTLSFVEKQKYKIFWTVDEDKLNSDEFWNNGGDPVSCHHCRSYDLKYFQSLFLLDKKTFLQKGKKIISFCFENLPPSLVKQVVKYSKEIDLDLYKNWKIKL